MTMRTYKVTLGVGGQARDVYVPSPTGVQAGDAAAPLMQPGEAILSIEPVASHEVPRVDAAPPKSQAAELAPATPGMAAAPERPSGLVAGGQGGPPDQLLIDGQEEVFAREEVETGRVEHHVGETPSGAAAQDRPAGIDGEPGELNRGLGKQRVGEAGPGPLQRPLDPAAGGPGTGAGSSATPSSEDQRATTPP